MDGRVPRRLRPRVAPPAKKASTTQVWLGRRTIELGADLVIGNHPHWVQAVEAYGDGFIAYSHGNFVFDQMWSRQTREGVVGLYGFDGPQLVYVRYIPVIIEEYAQPRLASPEEAEPVLQAMLGASQALR